MQVTTKDRRFTQEQVRAYIDPQAIAVPIDKEKAATVKSSQPKGGEKSLGFSRRSLAEEMRQWQ